MKEYQMFDAKGKVITYYLTSDVRKEIELRKRWAEAQFEDIHYDGSNIKIGQVYKVLHEAFITKPIKEIEEEMR